MVRKCFSGTSSLNSEDSRTDTEDIVLEAAQQEMAVTGYHGTAAGEIHNETHRDVVTWRKAWIARLFSSPHRVAWRILFYIGTKGLNLRSGCHVQKYSQTSKSFDTSNFQRHQQKQNRMPSHFYINIAAPISHSKW